MLLSGKNAVVTGGSRGIGFQISRILLENGTRVLAVSRDPSRLAEASEALPGISTYQADVSLASDTDRVFTWLQEKWGKLDILVNNAGILLPKDASLTEQPDDVFEETLRVNVIGAYLCTKRLLPLLLRSDDPRIVNVGSTAGLMGPKMSGAYGVSKAALHALTIALAGELQGKVAVNALSPGWVRTDMAPEAPGDPRTSAEAALWLLTEPREITGKLFRRKTESGWSS